MSLSDERIECWEGQGDFIYSEKDVQEAVEEFKEKIRFLEEIGEIESADIIFMEIQINKIFGSKLTGEEATLKEAIFQTELRIKDLEEEVKFLEEEYDIVESSNEFKNRIIELNKKISDLKQEIK